jgi:hypothetical protein
MNSSPTPHLNTNLPEHVQRRHTPIGRWMPALLYTANVVLWLITGILAGAWDLLWLVVWALPALGLYLWRTQRSRP